MQTSDIYLNFKQNLRSYLEINGITGQMLAGILGVNDATFRNWQSGRSYPKYDTLVNIARVFKITVDDLLCKHEIPNSDNDDPTLSSEDEEGYVYGDDYISQLSNADKAFVMKFRLLNQEDRRKLDEFLDELNAKRM